MRLNIDNLDPKVIGLIYEDKARHKHSTLAETLECLVKRAMGVPQSNLTETVENVVRKMLSKHKKESVVVDNVVGDVVGDVVEDKPVGQLSDKS